MGLSILTPAIVGLMLVAGVCYKMSEEMLREQIATDMTALLECQSIGLDAVRVVGFGDNGIENLRRELVLALGLVHDPHAAVAKAFEDLIARDFRLRRRQFNGRSQGRLIA